MIYKKFSTFKDAYLLFKENGDIYYIYGENHDPLKWHIETNPYEPLNVAIKKILFRIMRDDS